MDFWLMLGQVGQALEELSRMPNDVSLRKVIEHEERIPFKQIKAKDLRSAHNLLLLSEQHAANSNIVLKAHTDGLSFCPKNSEIAGTHYSHRAIVLQKLKLYKEALQDIELALEHPMSNEAKTGLKKRQDVIQKILEQKSKTEVSKEKEKLSYNENELIPGVSSAITVAYNETGERYLIASQQIKSGDILMIQKPFMYLSTQDVEDPKLFDDPSFVCHNCLQFSKASIPCENCIRAVYCSKKCRAEAYEKFHKTECQIPSSGEEEFNVALRMLMIISQQGKKLKEILKLSEELEKNPEKAHDAQDGKLDPNDPKFVLSLPNFMDKKKPTFTSYAGKIAFMLKTRTNIVPRDIDTFSLAKLTLLLLYIAAMNNLKIKRQSNNAIVGCGLYPIFSLMKNSGVSNTRMYDDMENNKIVCATRDIEAGERI